MSLRDNFVIQSIKVIMQTEKVVSKQKPDEFRHFVQRKTL